MKKLILSIIIIACCQHASAQTWQLLGTQGFSETVYTNSLTSLALDHNGVPYVAYADAWTGGKLTVMTYNGAAWVPVGNTDFTAGLAYDMSLAIDSNNVP